MAAGRRVQIFECNATSRSAEDLGRAAREINITGYVIGADYMAGRDRLLAALEARPAAARWCIRGMARCRWCSSPHG